MVVCDKCGQVGAGNGGVGWARFVIEGEEHLYCIECKDALMLEEATHWEHVTRDFLESIRTKRGGYTQKTVAKLGIAWPPQKGWMDYVTTGHPLHIRAFEYHELLKAAEASSSVPIKKPKRKHGEATNYFTFKFDDKCRVAVKGGKLPFGSWVIVGKKDGTLAKVQVGRFLGKLNAGYAVHESLCSRPFSGNTQKEEAARLQRTG